MGPFKVITVNADCAPCHLHECDDMRCLRSITPGMVAGALASVAGW
jgi:hypothetical protein